MVKYIIVTNNKVLIITGLFLGIIAGVSGGAFFAFTNDLPQIEKLQSFNPSAVSRVYSADNVLIKEFYSEKRMPVSINQMPEDLKTALVRTEDRSFYKHSGVDIKGILRAIVKDIIAGDFVEGASTITQQLAKTLFLTSKKTITRKIREAFLSFQLERRYTKDELLELYLNQVYFGSGAYGVESAARKYFGKSVSDLDLAECALLAAMPRSPSRYSPLVNPELAKKRRNIVLKILLKTGYIDKETCDLQMATPITLAERSDRKAKAAYFTEWIKKQIVDITGSSRLYNGGLTIHTTLSYELQKKVDASVNKRMTQLDKRMASGGLKDKGPQVAVISIDVETGAVLAMTGGRNFSKSPYNRATMAKRQPGSSFKPFVFACAIENGYAQNMLILDSPVSFRGARRDTPWEPENYSKTFLGEITLRKALALSKNIPAIRIMEGLGPSYVAGFARKFGIKSRMAPNLSLALGTSETTLMEMVSAYSVFPNRGKRATPFAISRILDRNGRVLWQHTPRTKIVTSRQVAAITTNMLEAVVKEGTGKRALRLERPVAGKTGTTDLCKDALFLGFSPSVATGVWVGLDNHQSLGKRETGAKAALPIWVDVMEQTFANKPVKYFDIPDGTIQVKINPDTGKAASYDSPGHITALFRIGNEPE